MNKKHIPTEDIKKYNRAFIKLMSDDEETDDEENKFRIPPLPLLTLKGIEKKPDKEN